MHKNVFSCYLDYFRIDPFTKKDWYDVKAPCMFVVRQIGKTLVTRTQGTSKLCLCLSNQSLQCKFQQQAPTLNLKRILYTSTCRIHCNTLAWKQNFCKPAATFLYFYQQWFGLVPISKTTVWAFSNCQLCSKPNI